MNPISLQSDLLALWAQTMQRSDPQILTMQVFLVVAEAKGNPVPQSVIRERLGLTESTTSRNVALLGVGSFGTPGPKLVESYEDLEYRRRKLVRLTAAGKRFCEAMQSIVDKHKRS